MTECNQSSFGFEGSGRREIVARFDGGTISSDGGAFLLRQVDKRLNLLTRFAECFLDGRNQSLVEHPISEMLAQRVYGLALGYEDINDHEQLRTDPVFGILAGKEDLAEPLAGKSTLNRMELGTGVNDRYKKITFWKEAVDELLVRLQMHEATVQWKQTGKPARVFTEFLLCVAKISSQRTNVNQGCAVGRSVQCGLSGPPQMVKSVAAFRLSSQRSLVFEQ